MKHLTKTLALLLCFAFILPLTACKDNSGNDNAEANVQTEPQEETTESILSDKVPELNFEGYEYRVLVGTYDRVNQDLYPEESIGEVLNDTIYNRNKKIETRFNIVFKSNTISLFELLNTIRKDVKSGVDSYDSYMQIDRDAYTAASEHLLYPIDELPHIDLTQPYWCQLPNKGLSVNNKLYWAYSDEMLSFFEAAVVLYFNKKQAEELNIGDIYALVRSGGWTHDKLYEYAKLAVKDLDGDGKLTEDDNWGIASEPDYLYDCFWIGSGVKSVAKDEDDIPYFALPGNQKFLSIAGKVIDEFNSAEGMFMNSLKVSLPAYGTSTPGRIGFFRNGHSLFSCGAIAEMIELRDMPDDFGILPFPKENAAQDQYYTRVCGGFPFVIPSTNARPEIAGAVMEAMACESRNYIIPAYYESALKLKYSRDPDTAEMLDLIFDTRTVDLGDTIWYADIRAQYNGIFTSGNDTFASFTEKNEEKIKKVIDKAVQGILSNE